MFLQAPDWVRLALVTNRTLAFAGDVNFAGRTRLLLDDPATAFGPIIAVLRSDRPGLLSGLCGRGC